MGEKTDRRTVSINKPDLLMKFRQKYDNIYTQNSIDVGYLIRTPLNRTSVKERKHEPNIVFVLLP